MSQLSLFPEYDRVYYARPEDFHPLVARRARRILRDGPRRISPLSVKARCRLAARALRRAARAASRDPFSRSKGSGSD